MESQNEIKEFTCRVHSGEPVQRVSTDESAPNPLPCIECIMVNEDKEARSKLIHFDEYLEKVVSHYNNLKNLSAASQEEVPANLTDFLSKEDEALTNLTACVESEKKKVTGAFDQISDQFQKLLQQKKTQLLKQLDDQVLILTFNFKTYRSKIEKFYKGVNDVSETDLPKLIEKINAFNNTSSLENYLKSINIDMAENSSLLTSDRVKAMEDGRKGLKEVSELLKKQTVSHPATVFTNSISTDEYVKKVFDKIEELFEEAFDITNNIEQVSGAPSLDSKILKKSSDVTMLRKWVNEKIKSSNWKLLYRGSKDGFSSANFHSKCDSKGPTVVLIKSNLGKIFGAFAEKDWSSSGSYQNSSNTFLFSIDRKAKYPLQPGHEGSSQYCNSSYGPTFGSGHDLYICNNSNTVGSSYSNFPSSFKCPDTVNNGNSSYLAGAYNFKVEEMEIFAVKGK